MRFDIITIFPAIFESYLNESLLGKAQKKDLLQIRVHNLRDFSLDKHGKVDDRPYGGGPGMVIQIEPVYKAVQSIKSEIRNPKSKTRVILFSPRGKKLNSKTAKKLSKSSQLILICGRYEGADERIAQYIADEEISVGDFVLNGGELAAMVLIESVSRFVPGVLGKYESLEEIKGSYPVYTRPEVFTPQTRKKWRVPKTLLSGNHKEIEEWRRKHSKSSSAN